jgi:benzylsuccinate CoA-transferase BbsE subunit
MAELTPLDPLDADAPLRGLRVVEMAGEFTGYAGRLFADLGADVTLVRLEGPGYEVTREPSLPVPVPDGAVPVDAAALFLHHGKCTLAVDVSSERDRRDLSALVTAADVLLQPGGADAPSYDAFDLDGCRAANPGLIQAVLTPFGLEGPAAEFVSADLVRLAAGGLLWLGGYPDGEPVAAFGGQSTQATAIYGAVAVLLALIDRDSTSEGRRLEISTQEVMTNALETSIPEYELTGRVQRRLGSTPREAGTGVYRCADGFVSMVAGRLGTAEAWTRLREWLVEAGTPGAAELWEEGWDELAFRQLPESIARFGGIFGGFAATRGKEELYLEAQRRSIAVAPVNDLDEVLDDRQLRARGFFVETSAGDALVPAAPFRLSPLGPEPVALDAPDAADAIAARRPT